MRLGPAGRLSRRLEASSSYVYGVGAFLLAGSELAQLSRRR